MMVNSLAYGSVFQVSPATHRRHRVPHNIFIGFNWWQHSCIRLISGCYALRQYRQSNIQVNVLSIFTARASKPVAPNSVSFKNSFNTYPLVVRRCFCLFSNERVWEAGNLTDRCGGKPTEKTPSVKLYAASIFFFSFFFFIFFIFLFCAYGSTGLPFFLNRKSLNVVRKEAPFKKTE